MRTLHQGLSSAWISPRSPPIREWCVADQLTHLPGALYLKARVCKDQLLCLHGLWFLSFAYLLAMVTIISCKFS